MEVDGDELVEESAEDEFRAAAVEPAANMEVDEDSGMVDGEENSPEFPLNAAAPALAVAEQIGPEDGMEIIQANRDERARELEILANGARREFEAALAWRGGD